MDKLYLKQVINMPSFNFDAESYFFFSFFLIQCQLHAYEQDAHYINKKPSFLI